MEKVPDITVILAHYNDAEHVQNAIRSVYSQTHQNIELILVDDCSNDSSDVVAAKSVSEDPRGTFVQLEQNSGGVGGPRRRGLELARGSYVMFLDSDDVLDRHACKNLLREARRTNADIVMARTRRFEVGERKWRGWHDRLYSEPGYFYSIEENPDLAIDTIVVSKLYNKQFLRSNRIQFPTDIHYEDLVFSAEAFKHAKGIAVIPESAYVWNIYPSEVRKSITNQRDSLRNLEFRLEALRRVIDVVDPTRNPLLLARLQLKILRHDVRLYLNDIRQGDDEFSSAVLKVLQPFIESVPADAFNELDYSERFLYGAALIGRPDLVRDAFLMIRHRATLVPPIKIADSHNLQWQPELLSEVSSLAQSLLTQPLSSFREIPWFQETFYHEVYSVDAQKDVLRIRARTFDPLAKLEEVGSYEISLLLFTRDKPRQMDYQSVSGITRSGDWITWECAVKLPSRWFYAQIQKIGLRVEISNRVARAEGHLTFGVVDRIPKRRVATASFVENLTAARFRVYRTIDGTIGLRKGKIGDKARLARTVILPVARIRYRLRRLVTNPVPTSRLKWKIAYWVMRQMPLRKNRSLFESHLGKSYADSPRIVSDELTRLFPSQPQIWSFQREHRMLHEVQGSVVRHSARYLYELARCEYLVDNQTFPSYFKKRKGQKYLQTWHGIPLKLMGLDEPDYAFASASKRNELVERVNLWDYLTIPSPYFKKTFVPAFRYTNNTIEFGSPRNDKLVGLSREEATSLKKSFGIPLEKKVVLYAPTFRADTKNSRRAIRLEMDLEEWIEALGDECVLLIRAHYLNRVSIHPRFAGKIVDVSSVEDSADLYAVTDVLITDYSSVMFDFATLNRPIIIYAYDLDKYVNDERGTYFSIEEFPPGIIVKSQEDLHSAVEERFISDPDVTLRREFINAFAGHESGDAAEHTVRKVWG